MSDAVLIVYGWSACSGATVSYLSPDSLELAHGAATCVSDLTRAQDEFAGTPSEGYDMVQMVVQTGERET